MEASQDSFSPWDLFASDRIYSLAGAFGLLILAYVAEHFANVYELEYSARSTSVSVGDLLLDNLPVVNLNFIIIEGALLSIVLGTAFIIFRRPRHILFSMKALAICIMARALFISLTHVGIYPGNISPGVGIFDAIYLYLNFQTGFFFSGHTALPVLMALIFWREPPVRAVFLGLAFVFGIAVLLAHIHYSIDVFAAPFIAYGMFKIARRLFPRDYEFIESASTV